MHAECWLVETYGLLYRCGLGLLIVKRTIEHLNAVLVADDTALLILLCFHTPIDRFHEIFFRPEAKSGTHKSLLLLGHKINVCEKILLGHALLGCDLMYCTACVKPEEIATAGERACILVAKDRYIASQKFFQKVSSSISCVQSQQLPPT